MPWHAWSSEDNCLLVSRGTAGTANAAAPFPGGRVNLVHSTWIGEFSVQTSVGLPSPLKSGPRCVDLLLHISLVMEFSEVFSNCSYQSFCWSSSRVGSSSGIHGVGLGPPCVFSLFIYPSHPAIPPNPGSTRSVCSFPAQAEVKLDGKHAFLAILPGLTGDCSESIT